MIYNTRWIIYEMNSSFVYCWFIMTMGQLKRLHRPIVIINQQYTKGEIHFIYLHYLHVFDVVLSTVIMEMAVFLLKMRRYTR